LRRYTPGRRFWKIPSADGSIQATIVIVFCQMLHYPLRWINQPRVIAEVIGGIILGPSVMMRIPGFQQGTSFS
jgi:Kef-type K+ transport system membrane component KefB